MKKIIATESAPGAIGPYSQAVRAGDLIFVSGQLPIDPATGAFAGDDIVSQTRQSLNNIRQILASEGASMEHVVRTGVFLKDMNQFGEMNQVYGAFFETDCPARAAVEVARLPKDALVEIEAVAWCPQK
ncbi:RidA family protein [Clostridium sp. AN503]|uniref:RidA family protein n=1 Tax=Clostridium sp. AN503 TaxID=3160598 RepID=UPI003458F5B3